MRFGPSITAALMLGLNGTCFSAWAFSPAAIDLVDAALLSSPSHRVGAQVTLVGPMANFEIDSDFGPFTAESVEMLNVRVEELAALQAIASVTRGSMYLRAAKAAGSRTASALGTVAMHPVESARGLPDGIRRLFARKLDSAKRSARDLGDRATDAARDRPDYVGQAPQEASAEPVERSNGERVGRAANSLALNYIGYNRARRESARLLNVDPYSSNPLLNERLDDLAWATLAGGFTFGKALALITGGASEVVSRTVQVNRVVWEKTPEDVRAYNEARLHALKLNGAEARKFLRNGTFSPTLQTALVSSIEALGPATGRTDVLDFAGSIQNELEARFLLHSLWMLEAAAAQGFKLYSFTPQANALLASGWDGSNIVPLPVDWLGATAEFEAYFREQLRAPPGTRVLVGGFVRDDARAMLESLKLSVEPEYNYPQRPAYARLSAE